MMLSTNKIQLVDTSDIVSMNACKKLLQLL